MTNSNPLPLAALLLVATLALGACGDAEQRMTSKIATVKPEPTKAMSKSRSKPEKVDMCTFISAQKVNAYLGGKLPLGAPKTKRDGCSYPVKFGVNGNSLSYTTLSRGMYDANKNWEKNKNIKFEYIEGLGQQAFIINNAQLCVLVSDTNAYIVRAQIIAMGEELPISQEELKAGLVKIATNIEQHF